MLQETPPRQTVPATPTTVVCVTRHNNATFGSPFVPPTTFTEPNVMAEASYDEKTKLLGRSNGSLDGATSYTAAINSDADSIMTSHSGVVHKQASWFMSVIYMALLVICGASMTLIISYQDKIQIPVYEVDENTGESYLACNITYPPVESLSDSTPGQLYVPSTLEILLSMTQSGGDEGDCHAFHQPFIQLFQMGVGQVLTGLSFPFFKPGIDDASVPLQDPGFWDFAPKAGLASLFDALAEVFIILGISATYPSTAELMKATLVVFVGMASARFFPGFHLNLKQWIATALMLSGAVVAMCQPYIDPQPGQDVMQALRFVVGAMMCLGAQMFYAMQFIVEEKLMDDCKIKNMHVNKGLLVFCEGWVSIISAIILQIPYMAITEKGMAAGYEKFTEDLHFYFATTALWAAGIGLSAAVAGFDIFGLLTAEHLGSDLRAVVTASFQVLLVWLMSAFWLKLEVFSYVFIIGFVLIVSAGFFYVFSSKRKEGPRHSDVKELIEP